jgi:hypothetical protein
LFVAGLNLRTLKLEFTSKKYYVSEYGLNLNPEEAPPILFDIIIGEPPSGEW